MPPRWPSGPTFPDTSSLLVVRRQATDLATGQMMYLHENDKWFMVADQNQL